ncbi:ABC transporter permease [Oscillospiraceae bacterium]|nr:ABC transporter permease [Oscillospiraceae bacterium]BDF75594.1 ABC transporter permease [Oscillospiraceae bacterium]
MHLFKKAVIAILTVYVVITVSFLMVRFMPGDPLVHLVGQERYYELLEDSPAELERIAQRYGLNDTLWEQYVTYLKSTVTLDFGIAYSNKQPVLDNVLERAGWTLVLSVPTFILGGLLGAALGVLAGWKPGGLFDKIATPIMLFLNTVPTNCIGILFLVAFAFKLGWFPVNGMTSGGLSGLAKAADILWHAALPLTLLVLFRTAGNFLLMKSNVSQIRGEEYITTAYSKGLGERKVLFVHVVKNAMLPFVTSLCMQFGGLLSGSMILEVIFGWRGMGNLFYTAVSSRDFPTAQLCFMISAVCIVAGNLLGDVVIAAIDPRIKEGLLEY